jgi:hypothetical protein
MTKFKTYLFITTLSVLFVQHLNAFIIKVINNSDHIINVEAKSASYSGWTLLVDAGETKAKDFGASCPWFIRVSDFLALKDEEPFAVNLHYGDRAEEQCIDKTITINFDEKRNKFMVHTDVIARGDINVQQWKNDWESPDKATRKYQSKL